MRSMLPRTSMMLGCVAVFACEDRSRTNDQHAAELRAVEERAARAEARAAAAEAEAHATKDRANQQVHPTAQQIAQQVVQAAQQVQRAPQQPQPTQEMLDEEWVLPTGGFHSFSLTLSRDASVHIEMTPVKHADKGLTLRVVPPEDFDACLGRSQGRCRSLGSFDGFKVRTFSHTDTISAGRWTFFVANTENIFNTATVHVRLVVNPSN